MLDSFKRRHEYYAVTDKQIVIFSELPFYNFRTFELKTLSDFSLTAKPNDRGNIIFGAQHPMAAWGNFASWPGMARDQSPIFEQIENAKSVYDKILKAQRTLQTE